MPNHTDNVWSWAYASVPCSFLTRPDTNSHRHGPTAGSNNLIWKVPWYWHRQHLSPFYSWANWAKQEICLKTQYLRAGVVSQVVECLPSKCEALSSNPNSAPPQKNWWRHSTKIWLSQYLESNSEFKCLILGAMVHLTHCLLNDCIARDKKRKLGGRINFLS
jgi:hypothetical protein